MERREDSDGLKKNMPSSPEVITLSSDESNDGAAMHCTNPAMENHVSSTQQEKIHDNDSDTPKYEQIKVKNEFYQCPLPANINNDSERMFNTHFPNPSHSREDQSHQPVAAKFPFQQYMTSHLSNFNQSHQSIMKPAINVERGKISVPSTQFPNTSTAAYTKHKNKQHITPVASGVLSANSKQNSSCFSSRLSRETNQTGKSQVLESKECYDSVSSQTTYNAYLTPKSQSEQLKRKFSSEHGMCGSKSAISSSLYRTKTNPGISHNKRSKNATPNIINQTPNPLVTRDGLISILKPLEMSATPRKSYNDKDVLSLQNVFNKSATSTDVKDERNQAVKLQNTALQSFSLQQIKQLAILGLKTLRVPDSQPHQLEQHKKPSTKTTTIPFTSAQQRYMQSFNTLSRRPQNRSFRFTPVFNRENFIPPRRKSTRPNNETKISSFASTLPSGLNSIAGNSVDNDKAAANKEVNVTSFSANSWNISNPYLQGNTNPSMPRMNIDFQHSDLRNCSGTNVNKKPDGCSQYLKPSTIHDSSFHSTPKNTNSFNLGINSSLNPSSAFPSNPMKTCSKASSGMTIPVNKNPETSQVWSGMNRRFYPETKPQNNIWRSWEGTAQVTSVNIPEEEIVTHGRDFPISSDHGYQQPSNPKRTHSETLNRMTQQKIYMSPERFLQSGYLNSGQKDRQVWSRMNRGSNSEINSQLNICGSSQPTAQVQPGNIPEEEMATHGRDFPLLKDHNLNRSQNVRITTAPSHMHTKTTDTVPYSCHNRDNSSNNSFGNSGHFNLPIPMNSSGTKNFLGLKAPAADHNPTPVNLPHLTNVRQGLFKPLKYISETYSEKAKNINPPYYALLQAEIQNDFTEPSKRNAKITFPDIPDTPPKTMTNPERIE